MEAIINNLGTLEELNEWAQLWGMVDTDLVNLRRIEIISDLANSCIVAPENIDSQR